jgi:hypothetical protein
MKRRAFVKKASLTALAPAALAGGAGLAAPQAKAQAAAASAGKAAAGFGSKPGSDLGKKLVASGAPTSDMGDFADNKGNHRVDPKAPYNMPLTKEEQDIMDGKKGPELAKVMKIVVAHGNTFGAEKLVDLGGAPHCSLYTGTDYMAPMIKLFQECADVNAGSKLVRVSG